MAKGFVILAAVALLSADAQAKPSPWSRAKKPSAGPPAVIGYYSAGCVQGAVKLPQNGKGYEVMRPGRRRYYGHPDLVSYIKSVAAKIKKQKLGPILVGDLGQPKGGPSPRGHASHQSGLDVDIWFWHPKSAEKRRLTRKERQSLPNHRVVNPRNGKFTSYWNDDIATFLRIAASEPRVSRVLVNPLIKKRLCETAGEDRGYLQKIRPWYGHADHMHVRLLCPEGSKDCKGQGPLPEGDGCDELDWWFDEKAQADRKKEQKTYQSKVGAVPELPAPCQALLD